MSQVGPFPVYLACIKYRYPVHFAFCHNSPPPAIPDLIPPLTQAVRITISTSSMELILSGMVLDVVHTTPAVPGTLHHGS